MTTTITPEVMKVLVQSTVDGDKLFLPKVQLERSLYVAVNKVLESIGGKWNTKAKAHLFEEDPSDVLDEIINTGEYTDAKKELQAFFTPEEVVRRMYGMVNALLPNSDTANLVWLEPNCGEGNILKWFPMGSPKIAIDINPKFIEKAKENCYTKHTQFICGDFLEQDPMDIKADIILMNPPFTKQQDIKHIAHAQRCLNSKGILISVVSESPFYRETKQAQDFRQWLSYMKATIIDLPHGAFAESGTNVKTRIIGVQAL